MQKKKKNKKEGKSKSKSKILRAPAALLRYFRASSIVIVAILFALLAPTPLIDKIHRERFGKNGRPPHPLKSRLLALEIQRACNLRSENALVEKLSMHSKAVDKLGFQAQRECKKTPHNKVFTEFREIVNSKHIAAIFEELVKLSIKLKVLDGKYIVLDSRVIDLCTACKCKQLKTCSYIQRGEQSFPKNCLIYRYEGAEPRAKQVEDKIYRYIGYKKHCAIDLKTGLRIATLFTPGNVTDSAIGLELLQRIHKLGLKPLYILADAGYDDAKIYDYIFNILGSLAIIKINPRNTIAEFFTIQTRENERLRISVLGTPLCKAGHRMQYIGVDGCFAIWKCAGVMDSSHLEDGKCLYNAAQDCRVFTSPVDEPRLFSLPPRETPEWWDLYRRRKEGEQTYSQYEQNLGLDIINYTSYEDIEIHVLMIDITLLTAAIMAKKLRIPEYVRDVKEVAFYVQQVLYGEELHSELSLEVIDILCSLELTTQEEILKAVLALKKSP